MGITSLMLEPKDIDRDSELVTKEAFFQDNSESLGLIMASSSLLLNLINNLLDVKKATANSKWNLRVGMIGNNKDLTWMSHGVVCSMYYIFKFSDGRVSFDTTVGL